MNLFIMLLEVSSKQIIGISALCVFIAIAAVLGGITGKKKQVKNEAAFKEKYDGKTLISNGEWLITTDRKVVYSLQKKPQLEFREFNLDDIAYVMAYRESGVPHFAFYDVDKKAVKGIKTVGGNESSANSHFILERNHVNVWPMISANKPDVTLVGPYFKEVQ